MDGLFTEYDHDCTTHTTTHTATHTATHTEAHTATHIHIPDLGHMYEGVLY